MSNIVHMLLQRLEIQALTNQIKKQSALLESALE